jgi:uncharacterized sulfatase
MNKKKPNILLITSDQHHWATIGAYNKEVHTPNLDRLVKEGSLFSRAYCPNPTCTATRASIITGLYPSQHGAWTLGTKLPEDTLTLGDIYLKNNYRTALIGKAHFQPLEGTDEFPSLESYPVMHDLEFWKNYKENFYGFEHIELARNHTNEAHAGQHYALWLEEKGCTNWRDYFLNPTGNMSAEKYKRIEVLVKEKPRGFVDAERTWGEWAIPEKFHYNTWIAERTNKLLDEYKENDENFFLWASFPDPHPEYFVPEPWASMYDPEKITLDNPLIDKEHEKNPPHFKRTQEEFPKFDDYMDTGFEIHGCHSHLQKEKELRKDVALYYGMISFMDKYIGKILDKLDELELTENTLVIFTTDHGHFLGQHGLIRKGPFHYEDMIKIPFIARYPNYIPANVENHNLQSLVDLAPTFLKYSGIEIPRTMTGLDQTDVWNGGEKNKRAHIIVENRHEPFSLNLRTYVDEKYKITVYHGREFGELFDLEKDPLEHNNLWNNPEYKDLKTELLLKYTWAELAKEPMWMPRIKHA